MTHDLAVFTFVLVYLLAKFLSQFIDKYRKMTNPVI